MNESLVKDMVGKPEYAIASFWTDASNIHEIYIQYRIFNQRLEVHEILLFHFIKPTGAIRLSLPHGNLKATHSGNLAEKHIDKAIVGEVFNHYSKPGRLDGLLGRS